MNNWAGIGRITKDPQMGAIPSTQTTVCKFHMAIDDGYGEKKKTNFIPITVFGKQAENCERYLGKGQRVAVQGKISTGSYTNKDGQKVYTTDVIADRVEIIDFKNSNAQNSNQSASQGNQQAVPEGFTAMLEEDCPF